MKLSIVITMFTLAGISYGNGSPLFGESSNFESCLYSVRRAPYKLRLNDLDKDFSILKHRMWGAGVVFYGKRGIVHVREDGTAVVIEAEPEKMPPHVQVMSTMLAEKLKSIYYKKIAEIAHILDIKQSPESIAEGKSQGKALLEKCKEIKGLNEAAFNELPAFYRGLFE